MKPFSIIFLLCIATITAKAQVQTYTTTLPTNLIGKWVLINNHQGLEPLSISFYSDGIINLDKLNTKQVQRYQVTQSTYGYNVNIVELINQKTISKFNILSIRNDVMEITYGGNRNLYYAQLRKVKEEQNKQW
jgi:hypothetical protein